MSDYTNTFGGAAKDTAHSTILGSEMDTEFNNIGNMSATKANKISGPTANRLVLTTGSGDIAQSAYLITDMTRLAATQTFTGTNTFSVSATFTGGLVANGAVTTNSSLTANSTTTLAGTTTQSGTYTLSGTAYFTAIPSLKRDTASAAQYFMYFRNNSNVLKWSFYLSADSAGPDFYILNASGASKLQLAQDGLELKTTSTDITYGGTSIKNPVVVTSAETYYTGASQLITWTHSKGALPDVLTVYATCYSADGSYAAGDVVCLSASVVSESDAGSGPVGDGYTVYAESATDNAMKIQITNRAMYIHQKGGSGVLQTMSSASKWKLWFKGIWF